MPEKLTPDGIAKPASHYHHAFLVRGLSDLMTLSGQLGEREDGSCPADAGEQARIAWHNVRRILQAGDLDLEHVVKVTSYIVGRENIPAYVAVHKEILGDLMAPWTLVVVEALGNPEYLVEVDVLAARGHGRPA